ncbi:MarR family transcriptional regulator [Epidermidibacterium keratini]|uniref:MarR family transcriptional regulator n=1 Tax=Epidermidibacterium keratini TaxID=1891644 RepID=A0A7L4YNU9_9ACTN|nr:MarR family transcriptional regulator [Epidermidibacterium keratini]QHC00830.1 MarR family transcriptional regulator [Epidermidibacterium keratini]
MSRREVFRAFIDAVGLHGEAAASAAGVSGTDWFVLSLLEQRGPLLPSELGRLAGLTSGATTRLIDRLEHAGRVRRTRSEDDRRKVIVSRTEEAFADGEIAGIVDPARDAVGAVLDGFTAKEQDVLYRFFAEAAPAFHQATEQIRQTTKNARSARAAP